MSRKLLLSVIGGVVAGTALAAGGDAVTPLMAYPATAVATICAECAALQPDSLATLLATLGLMGAIAHRRSR